ncbi:hypothetical protein SmJEL517_g05124 [Synchytrium microbalum]|uniref:RNA helicase n=1 Tax=Synchytrium microbalum TaxID=1806994 RepID=A0A507BR02_9FUNG|nr:uncharacterized protein SmJEL517_g05124 [Synchytrium microbalum]TPX31597.1 hypothetical protein SmJEL517_g05124 [Synchytrium microbalum]
MKKGGLSSSSSAAAESKGKSAKESPSTAAKGSKGKSVASSSSSVASESGLTAAELKRQLFGSWTGKTPQVLLNEYCQKRQWSKPDINCNLAKAGAGWKCSVTLVKVDPKTKAKQIIKWDVPVLQVEQDQEAKHFASTYALHRLCSGTSYHRLLPPNHRDYWLDVLEPIRASVRADEARYQYAADPFASIEWRAKDEADAAKLVLEKERDQAMKAKQEEEEFPAVVLGQQVRAAIEELIKQNLSTAPANTSNPTASSDIDAEVATKLLKMGFRKAHVDEALTYESEFEDARNWLTSNVPEDDLPPGILPPISEFSVGRNTEDAYVEEQAYKRIHALGFDMSKVKSVYRACKRDEILTLERLCLELCGNPSLPNSQPTESEALIVFKEESEALGSIYADSFRSNSETTFEVSLTSPSISDGSLAFYLNTSSTYPHHPIIVVLQCPSLPAYIRLSCTKKLMEKSIELAASGEPAAFALVENAQENWNEWVENPPLLMSLVSNAPPHKPQKAVESHTPAAKLDKVSRKTRKSTQSDEEIRDALLAQESTAPYQKMLSARATLPAHKNRQDIITAVKSSQVVICGETGCGKSTQIPQILYEEAVRSLNGSKFSLICTQPRRISAMALAERTSAERCEDVGRTVGYAIRGERRASQATRILFCTVGIVVRMVSTSEGDGLEDVSVIVIDEVHERGVESDFMLIALKELLPKRPDLKVILMSATVQSDSFSKYFGGAPVLNIPGRTFPVDDVYLEDLLVSIPPTTWPNPPRRSNNKGSPNDFKLYTDRIERLDDSNFKIDYDLIAATVRHICTNMPSGAILIFLPGVMEIQRCMYVIKDLSDIGSTEVYPLHANLSSREQSQVFRRVPKHVRKIVVSTNVAETSLTIDDVVYVIDACKQRRGRAGRTQKGICYKLVTRKMEDEMLPAEAVAEIQRKSLDQLCLNVLAMGIRDVSGFLSKALDPPQTENIEFAMKTLLQVGAVDDSGGLSPLGEHLAKIPTDLRIGKILLFGAMFQCLEPILTVCAVLSHKSPWVQPSDKRDEAKAAREKFATERSDSLTDVRAYEAWVEASWKSRRDELDFCESNFLSKSALATIADYRKQYYQTLSELGFIHGDTANVNSSKPRIVKAALLAGLYPRFAIIKLPQTTYAETSVGTFKVDADPKSITFCTQEDGQVAIHPSSVNYGSGSFVGTPLLLYHQKVHTSAIFLRDTTAVSAWPLLLLNGRLDMQMSNNVVIVDGWVSIRAFPRIAVLVEGVRKLLSQLLDEKIKNPKLDISESEVVRIMLRIIEREGM